MSQMTSAYLGAMALSYANQRDGIDIPDSELSRVVVIPLGFQPMGMGGRRHQDGDEIAIAGYFEPAVCLARVTRDMAGLHLRVSWIRGVDHGIESVRLFPGVSQPGGANRAQTVNFTLDGNLWVSRNGERDFYVLTPPSKPDGRWTLTGKVSLPSQSEDFSFIHAAFMHMHDTTLSTVEGNAGAEWTINHYNVVSGNQVMLGDAMLRGGTPLREYRYGIGLRRDRIGFWTITDIRSQELHGIYCNETLVLPDIEGNGIYFLADGSALVTRYGQGHPGCSNGIPGALIYVPASYLS